MLKIENKEWRQMNSLERLHKNKMRWQKKKRILEKLDSAINTNLIEWMYS